MISVASIIGHQFWCHISISSAIISWPLQSAGGQLATIMAIVAATIEGFSGRLIDAGCFVFVCKTGSITNWVRSVEDTQSQAPTKSWPKFHHLVSFTCGYCDGGLLFPNDTLLNNIEAIQVQWTQTASTRSRHVGSPSSFAHRPGEGHLARHWTPAKLAAWRDAQLQLANETIVCAICTQH